MITLVNKPVGMTPSVLMEELFKKFPENIGKKYSFYGKLDPMADGLMTILWEKECQNPFYNNLEKRYVVEIAVGVTTDTGDLMGLITSSLQQNPSHSHPPLEPPHLDLESICQRFTRDSSDLSPDLIQFPIKIQQPYPDFSYLKVKKKPLWWWSQQGLIDSIRELIPKKTVEIKSVKLLSVEKTSLHCLNQLVKIRVSKVKGNFRQEEIIACWENASQLDRSFHIVKLELHVSNGTYIRHLAERLGGVVINLTRISLGPFKLDRPDVVQLE